MKIPSAIILLIACSQQFVHSQNISVVDGKFSGFQFGKISIQSDDDPFTEARDEFEAVILDSGRFRIQPEFYGPKIFLLLVDNNPLAQFFLCPGEDLTITADSGGIKFNGPTADYKAWNRVLQNDYVAKYSLAFAERKLKDQKNIDSLVNYLFAIRDRNLSMCNKLVDEFALSECEYLFCKDEIEYALFTYLWSNLIQRGYSIEDEAFQFMNRLRLDDTEAARISLSYNRALEVFLFLNLRLEHKWYDPRSFDPSSDLFNNLYYEKILTAIPNENIRNVLLTRKVISLLSTGSLSAEPLFKRYLHDCTDPFSKKVASKYYNDYRKEKQDPGEKIHIEQLEGSLFERLRSHKGKILYVDFWASWCGPCIKSLPASVNLQEKYRDSGLEVIYVSIDDNLGSAESAAKRLGLIGNLIYLDKKQSDAVRKTLGVHQIPHYTLVDANGVIIDSDAPPPDSSTIKNRLQELLGK